MVLDLVDKGLVTNQIVLTIGYDIENITDKNRSQSYKGTVTTNYYGKKFRSLLTERQIFQNKPHLLRLLQMQLWNCMIKL